MFGLTAASPLPQVCMHILLCHNFNRQTKDFTG
ncbi:hypothetical protein NC651_011803 [Populus alba x Populus x berolinensis]|nr:hypothetical protein NC651_011803 [Populus alba x Populus x berolinensis]